MSDSTLVMGNHDLARLEAKVDALPTKELIRAMIVRGVARTTALAAPVGRR